MLRDAEFGPVRLRAFGSFAFRVKDPGVFIKEVAATNPEFTVEGINEQLRNLAVSRGMDAIAEAKIPVLDLAANYDEVSARITEKIKTEFNELGLELTKFLIENISLPPEVEAALDKRSSMGIVGNLGAYAQYQAANAMEEAAKNPGGGLAGAGLGAGVGMAIGSQLGNVFQPNTVQSNDSPPPLPTATPFYAAIDGKQAGPYTMEQLSQLITAGTINQQSQVWHKGMPSWAAANTVPELASLFNNIPPPLPGA
jgi:membrane protease subunit (stomatin/prohibitin family)